MVLGYTAAGFLWVRGATEVHVAGRLCLGLETHQRMVGDSTVLWARTSSLSIRIISFLFSSISINRARCHVSSLLLCRSAPR
ncbi:hypothetical protein BKA18_002094 [Streptomyces auratus]